MADSDAERHASPASKRVAGGEGEQEPVMELLDLLRRMTTNESRFYKRFASPEGRYYYQDLRTGIALVSSTFSLPPAESPATPFLRQDPVDAPDELHLRRAIRHHAQPLLQH